MKKKLIVVATLAIIVWCCKQATAQTRDHSTYHITHFTDAEGLVQNTVKSIATDNEGYLWIATEAGLTRFDGSSFSSFNVYNSPLSAGRMHFLYRTGAGGPLYVISDFNKKIVLSCGKPKELPDSLSRTELLYLADHKAAYRNSYMPANHFINRASGQVFEYKNGVLFCEMAGSRKPVLTGFDMHAHRIISAFYDTATHTVFLGSVNNGLFICREKAFTPLLSNRVHYVHMPLGEAGLLTGEGLYADRAGNTAFWPEIEKRSDFVTLLQDNQQRIWTERGNCISVFSPDGKRELRRYCLNASIIPRRLLQASDSTIWVGTLEHGIWYLAPGASTFQFLPGTASLLNISYLAEQSPGRILAGTASGLHLVTKNSDKPQLLIPLKDLKSILVCGPNEVWISTYSEGLFLYRNNRYIRLPFDYNGWLAPTHCIVADRYGSLWLSTNKGLYQASRKDLLAYAYGKTSDVYYHYYNKENGFNINEFNGTCQPCGIMWPDGLLSFPSMNGLVFFDPLQARPIFPDKGIYIDYIETEDTAHAVLTTDTITTKAGMKWINLLVSTPFMGNKNNLRLEYRLAGYDDVHEWQVLDEHKRIRYTSLPPGKYQLVIRKLNGFGAGNYTYKNILIEVPPFFYQTVWFAVLCGIGVMAMLFFYIRWRFRKIERLNRKLELKIEERTVELQSLVNALVVSENKIKEHADKQEKINAAITHDIISPLHYLTDMSETIAEQPASDAEIRKYMLHMRTTTRQVYNYSQNLSRYIKQQSVYKPERLAEEIALHTLVQDVIADFTILASNQSNRMRNEIDRTISVRSEPDILRIILHNLVDNANKYTHNGSIVIRAAKAQGMCAVTITDTGLGMPDAVLQWCNDNGLSPVPGHSGIGLLLVKELATRLYIQLAASHNTPAGTKITLYIPYG